MATSGTISAFAIGAEGVGISEVDSPVFNAPTTQARLSFRHTFNLESSSPGTGLDGAVLEISIDGGAFADVLDAGGTFIVGGYNCTIAHSTGDPLGGRQAWSGDSGGFITTSIELPPACWGQPVQFRWRLGSDESTASVGWHVDDVALSGISCCYEAPVITNQPQSQAVLPGQNALFQVSAIGTPPLEYQWRFHGTNLPGATGTNYAVIGAQTNDAGPYDVVVSNAGGTITSSVATLTIFLPPMLISPQVNSNETFGFILSGNAGYNYLIETSTNLSNWTVLTTLSNASGEVLFTDTNSLALPFRAYRAQLIP